MSKPKKETVVEKSATGEVLTETERKLLEECENTIASSEKSYIAVGGALFKIREQQLHKGSHSSFDDYCEEKWGFSGSHAHRLIKAVEVVTKLRDGKIVDAQLPRNEYQARLLEGGRKAHHWVRTWNKVLKEAGNSAQDVTTSVIKKVLKKKEEESSEPEKTSSNTRKTPKQVSTALELIENAKAELETGQKKDWKAFLDRLEKLLKQVK